ncbi:uncharacterized protein CDV56_107824 [Aspergillus thermomutatus]|uniref:Uncharacterized protein n=1 Tax=Aspergillus thermomutatus TaxID=41047 RepID=A0A397I209_ASPTH|nr:uncharacterized protein CDV56_107824 [Aspergillus thermomutatus]RHZ67333.1 hypothetical protein CDV56_107824 [Aspergillus thermomutatus]
MSTSVWDPDSILQISDASGRGMFCVGLARSRYDSRCRWNIPQDRYTAVLSVLDDISMKLPHNVTNSELRRLARLGLCEYHGHQEGEIVAKWENVLRCVDGIYRAYERREEETTRKLVLLGKEIIECRSLLGVKEDCDEACSVVLRRYINNNAQLKEELVAIQATCARLQKDQEEESCRLSAENSRLSTLLKRAEEEQQRCQNQESNVTAECEKLRKQNAALQADVDSGKDKCKDLQDREKSATMELIATTAQLHGVQSVNLGLENDKKALQSEIDIPKQEVKRLSDSNTSISSQLARTTASLETVTTELSAAHQANMELREELTAATGEIRQLSGTTDTIQVVERELSAAHKENMQLRVELTTSTRQIIELRSKISELSTPVWHRLIQWIQQKLSGLKHLLKPDKEVSDEEEGVALAQGVAVRDAGLA